MIDTQKTLFFYCCFFAAVDFAAAVKLPEVANSFLKSASIPKTARPFSFGVMGKFFQNIFSEA
jgi:hypothetical protein